MRRLACCHIEKGISLDLDEQERIMKYDGLESCILNNHSYNDESSTSRAEGCATDSLDENDSVCSSSKDASGSFSSSCLVSKEGEHGPGEEEVSSTLKQFYVKEKESNAVQFTHVETMKDKFSKLLLGEDVTGGCKGLTTALALSNAITNLAASVFGELWKLEPLSEEKKIKWRREMSWFISPTNYMVELVPARQSGTNGRSLEIMTPKARADIRVNLPALQKLDSMLIETLDSMVKTEFWYAEGGSRAEGRSRSDRPSKRWWLPSPQVPTNGLSASGRKKLLYHGKLVHQVFKAAKVINSNVLLEMPVPTAIRNALPKSGKENLGVELYRILSAEVNSMDKTIASLGFKSEHSVLQTMNQLETAILAWKETVTGQTHGKSPVRNSWSFMRDSVFELDRIEALLDRAQALLQVLHIRYPNLPHTFLDVTKVKYNKDVGHSILEAYSRVLANLAFSILSRIRDILEEDDLSNPNSPVVSCCFSSINLTGSYETPAASGRVRNSLIDQMKKTDGRHCDLNVKEIPKVEISDYETKIRSSITTPSRSRVWCIGVPLTNCP